MPPSPSRSVPARRAAIPDSIAACATVLLFVGFVASIAVIAILLRRGDATWLAYAVALLGALGFGMGLLGSPATRVKACLFVVSIAVPLYVADGLLAIGAIGAPATGPAWDQRTRLEVMATRRAQGAEPWPPGNPELFIASDGLPDAGDPLYPLAGVPGAEIIYCNDSGAWHSYVSDEHGFNNPRGLHAAGRAKVLVIGDSFAHGNCVPPGEDVAGVGDSVR